MSNPSRSAWRARSHAAAHEDPGRAQPDVIVSDLVHAGEPELVDSQPALAALLGDLRRDGSFAYDSEFIGELTYFPKLCLVQVASRRRLALIDPLSGIDMTGFWELLADAAVEKIVHAGAQDLEPVVRHLKRPAANVLDTQIGAAFIGLPYPISLKKVVSELAGGRLGRDLGFSDWEQRPLSQVQLRYAADDVRYLPAAAQELARRLEKLGHAEWAKEECAAVCAPELFGFNRETQYLRVRGAGALPPRSLAVLRELASWRDGAARAANLPPRAFLKDEVLILLAGDVPASVERLARIRGIPAAVIHNHGKQMVEAMARALALPADQLPNAADPEPSPSDKFRSDAFFALAQTLCAGQSIDPGLVANRKDVNELYRYVVSGKAGTAKPALFQGWRGKAAGEWLGEFLRGRKGLSLRWEQGALRSSPLAEDSSAGRS